MCALKECQSIRPATLGRETNTGVVELGRADLVLFPLFEDPRGRRIVAGSDNRTMEPSRSREV